MNGEMEYMDKDIEMDTGMVNLNAIAMFIDADNTQLAKLEAVIREVSVFGRVVVKRAYGNWTKSILKNWDNGMKSLAIKPMQQTDYVKGKNTTDIALTIDVMDLLHSGKYDGFALVSSDSDFTPLALKLREEIKYVIGIGEAKTPQSFITACDSFINIENLPNTDEGGAAEECSMSELEKLIRMAYERYQDDEGFVNVSSAGTYIKRIKPEFNIRNYGYKKLPEYLDSHPELYETTRYPGKGRVTIVAFRIKEGATESISR